MKNYIFGYPNLFVFQDNNLFKMSLDSVLISNFVTLKKNGEILDIGTGNAPIPTILSTKTLSNITGVEIQKEIFECAKKTLELNNLKNVKIINDDIRKLYKNLPSDSFDTIISNPPYFKVTENINDNEALTIARHEVCLKLEDIIVISKKLLKNGGNLALVGRPYRLIETIELMRNNNIEPKRVKFIYPKKGKESNIMLIEGTKNGKVGIKVLEPLYVYNENNEYSKELLEYIG